MFTCSKCKSSGSITRNYQCIATSLTNGVREWSSRSYWTQQENDGKDTANFHSKIIKNTRLLVSYLIQLLRLTCFYNFRESMKLLSKNSFISTERKIITSQRSQQSYLRYCTEYIHRKLCNTFWKKIEVRAQQFGESRNRIKYDVSEIAQKY